MTVYQRPDGSLTPNPPGKELAQQLKSPVYDACTPCPECRTTHSATYARFTLNDRCLHCARLAALAAYNDAITTGEPITAADAQARGAAYYWGPEMCPKAGHLGRRTITGQCWECRENRERKLTPRQAAMAAGEKWYTPEEPCPHGHMAPRCVYTGRCRECLDANRTGAASDYLPPDTVISWDAARALGMTVYRTGKLCRRGHRGWRYVSNKGCIDCKK